MMDQGLNLQDSTICRMRVSHIISNQLFVVLNIIVGSYLSRVLCHVFILLDFQSQSMYAWYGAWFSSIWYSNILRSERHRKNTGDAEQVKFIINDPLRLFHFTTDMKMKTMPPRKIQKTTAKSPIPWSERAKADLTHQPDARVARIPRAHLPEPTAAWMWDPAFPPQECLLRYSSRIRATFSLTPTLTAHSARTNDRIALYEPALL